MIDYKEVLDTLEHAIKKIEELTAIDNLSLENAKQSRAYGKIADKCIMKLVKTDEGVNMYKKWLDSSDDNLKWSAGLYLFPIFPKKCLKVLIECERINNNKLAESCMKSIIEAYKKPLNDDNIFYKRLKKLYKTENLELLNKSE